MSSLLSRWLRERSILGRKAFRGTMRQAIGTVAIRSVPRQKSSHRKISHNVHVATGIHTASQGRTRGLMLICNNRSYKMNWTFAALKAKSISTVS